MAGLSSRRRRQLWRALGTRKQWRIFEIAVRQLSTGLAHKLPVHCRIAIGRHAHNRVVAIGRDDHAGVAAQTGRDPVGVCRDAGKVIPTYCNDTVMRMAPDGDPAMDRQRMREIGRRLAESYLKDPPLLRATAATAIRNDGVGCQNTIGFSK